MTFKINDFLSKFLFYVFIFTWKPVIQAKNSVLILILKRNKKNIKIQGLTLKLVFHLKKLKTKIIKWNLVVYLQHVQKF